jgi:hypothetical protein
LLVASLLPAFSAPGAEVPARVHADSAVLELPAAEVTGSPDGDVDAAVYRLDAAALRRFATLEEALDALPGFRVRRQGGLGGYSELSFRGARGSQVDIYVDGIRLNQDGDAAPDLSKWPLLWFTSLEARAGFGPEGSGTGALARVDLSTRDESRANFQGRAGSFGAAEAALSAQAPVGAGWKLSVGAQGQGARNDYPYFSDNGTAYNPGDDGVVRMDNNAYRSRGVRAALRREEAASRQTVSVLWLDSRKEYPGIFPGDARAYTRRSDWLGAWRLERFEGRLPWEIGLQARRFEDAYRDPGQSLGYLSYESARLSTSGEGDARARLQLAPRLGARADARLRAEETKPRVTPYSAAYSSPDATRGEAQGGLAADLDLTPPGNRARTHASASLEARGSLVRFRAEGLRSFPDTAAGLIASKDYRPTALRASLQWGTGAQALRHTVGFQGRLEERAPTSGELLGDNVGVLSKMDLRPEQARALSFSHALTGASSRAAAKASVQSTVFWNDYRDPIRLKAHGASSFMRYENDADYRSLGFEAQASAGLRLAEASLSLTWQDLSVTEGFYKGNRPAYQSPVEIHAEFFIKPPAKSPARAGMLADFRSAYYPGDANVPDSRRAAEWELGAHADAQLGTGGPLRLAFDARNLTGRHYRDFAYSPRSGRSYSLSLSFTL